jgi:S1-C subfamily serine protease
MFESDKDSQLVETWQRFVQAALGVLMLVGAGLMAHYYAPPPTDDLQQRVQQLTRQVAELQKQQKLDSVPAFADDARDSVAYVCGIYHVTSTHSGESFRARVAGTGFVVAPGLLATNRHVAEPWYRDREVEAALRQGGTPVLEKLVAYFPGSPIAVELKLATVAKFGDLAVLRMQDTAFTESLHPLSMSHTDPRTGDAVSVIAYPMGVTGMVAKSPATIYERLSARQEDSGMAGELAALSLIRPSATFGHIGDVTADKLIYDAPTARGGSGGPVLNARGEVVGVNSAYIDGFSGGTLGISVAQLLPLIDSANKPPVEAAASKSR